MPKNEKKYVGVHLSVGRYRGHVHYAKQSVDVGRWDTARGAAIARDRAILFLKLDKPLQVPGVSRRKGPRSPRLLRADARNNNRVASTQYIGITQVGGLWHAACEVKRKKYQVGGYKTAREAAFARDRMVLHYAGPDVELNFPRRKPTPASRETLKQELIAAKPPRPSKYHGVHLSKTVQGRPWQTMVVGTNGRSQFCGLWENDKDAAIAHDRAALHLFSGKPPILNFPRRRLGPVTPAQLKRQALAERKRSNSSQYLGVHWQKGAWVAAITLQDGSTQYLGRFEDEEKAARIRDREARKYSGPRTKFNFPRRGER